VVVWFNQEALEVLVVALVDRVLVQTYLAEMEIPLFAVLHRAVVGVLVMVMPQFMVQGEGVVLEQ
jgi:hypothetical protein